MTCWECRQPTTADQSRRVWLKDKMRERRLCVRCLDRRGLQLVPKYRDGEALDRSTTLEVTETTGR